MVSHSSSSFGSPNGSPNKNTITLTDVSIRSLKSNSKRVTFWGQGTPGFGIRITPKGSKSFIFSFWFEGKKHWLTLGKYPAFSLREARKKYSEAAELLEQGINPAAKEKKRKSKILSVNALIDKYEAHCLAQGKKSTTDEIRALRKDMSDIGHRNVCDLDTGDILEILNNVAKRKRGKDNTLKKGAPQMAHHLYAYVHRMFRLAVQWGHIAVNPVSALDKPSGSLPKSRVLSPAEIFSFWHGLDNSTMQLQTKLALKFMLCTVQRGVNVREMFWSDFDTSEKGWTIPQPKNKRAWRVPLNNLALGILKQASEVSKDFDRPFAFDTDGMMSKWALNQAIRRDMEALGIAHFTPHDLRRTAATLLAAVGCPRYWVVLMLNHTDGTVTSIYDQYSYDAEKRKAVEVLDFVLSRILEAKKVGSVPTLDTLREMVNEAGLLK